MENSFLKEFKEREYYNQCTNEIELENIMGSSKIKAYIGFDCTAQSLHVGSLLQIMCLRLLQKFGHQLIPTNFCASTANSIGNCCRTSLQNPLTINPTASSGFKPLC